MTKDITSSFDDHDLTNGIMPLITLLALCETDTAIIALHDQKDILHIFFNHLDLMNTMVLLTMAQHHIMLIPVLTVSNN